MNRRVVITGLGVVSPNGVGVPDFLHSIRNGVSGIRFMPEYEQLNFNFHVTGLQEFDWGHIKSYIPEVALNGLKAISIGYGIKAALDAWTDAGNTTDSDQPRWETGCIFGSSVGDTSVVKNVITRVDAKESKKLGSRVVEQIMNSGVTAYISGRLGLANTLTTNSATPPTDTQAILTPHYQLTNH